jgi:hypothetical protein
MAIGSGLSSQLGLKAETTYGTPVTVDRFLEYLNESIVDDTSPVDLFQLGMGRVQRSSQIVQVQKGGSGSVEFNVLTKGFGVLLDQCFGASAVAQVGATAEWTQTFTIDLVNGQYGKNATYQIGMAQTDGVMKTKTLAGGKVTGFHFSAALDEPLTLIIDLVGRQIINTTALATATYANGRAPYVYSQGILTVGGVSTVVKAVTIDVDQGLADDRFGISSPLRREPIAAGPQVINGSFDCEFESLVHWDQFRAGTLSAMVLEFTAGTIPTTAATYKATFTLPSVRFTGETPQVGGPEIIRENIAFQALYDGSTNPFSLVLHTDDISL